MATSVYCLAPDRSTAVAIVDALRIAGLRGSDVSVVYPSREDAPSGAGAGAAQGGGLGTSVGWLMGMGTLAIPGLGLLIAEGPILAILSGPSNGTMCDGLAGSLIGHGIPEVVARRIEMKVRDGQVLICVHAIDGAEVDIVTRLMEQHGAEGVFSAPDARPEVIAESIRIDHERAADSHAGAPGHRS